MFIKMIKQRSTDKGLSYMFIKMIKQRSTDQ